MEPPASMCGSRREAAGTGDEPRLVGGPVVRATTKEPGPPTASLDLRGGFDPDDGAAVVCAHEGDREAAVTVGQSLECAVPTKRAALAQVGVGSVAILRILSRDGRWVFGPRTVRRRDAGDWRRGGRPSRIAGLRPGATRRRCRRTVDHAACDESGEGERQA